MNQEQQALNMQAAHPGTGRSPGMAISAMLWMLRGLKIGRLDVTLPNGSLHRFRGQEPGPHGHLQLRNGAVLRKVLLGAATGFAESYMDGDWNSPNLAETLHVLMLNQEHYRGPYDRNPLVHWMGRTLHAMRANTKTGSRRNIQAHYDLGNTFYELWLDETMTYSAAVFEPMSEDLAAAQHRKYQAILDRLDLRPEHHLLEIGSGWGGFAIHAAQTTGCRITSITLSDEQLAEARRRAEAAGVADRVEFRFQDYRDLREQFDRVVSIEMYEAVGEAFWPTYFRTIRNVLRQDGVAVLQGITIDHAHFDDYRQRMDFIQKYIFPGGMLASPEAFTQAAADVGLQADRPDFFGPHYAETLRRWHDKVLEHRDAIVSQFDERFLRMWRYYLAYCECGFDDGRIDVMHIALRHAD